MNQLVLGRQSEALQKVESPITTIADQYSPCQRCPATPALELNPSTVAPSIALFARGVSETTPS